ncbi:MAG: RNA methyltransferase [Clostridium sp.]|nr:RNA methyltransferase [Clostridium sp.]
MEKKNILDLNRVGLDDYRTKRKIPLVVVLDNIRSLNNIGSVFRTADAFLISEIMLCGISATPPSPEIHKTALGAEDSVCWSWYESTADALAELRRRDSGVEICCLEQVKRSVSLERFRPDRSRSYALVLGHEVKGVAQEIVDLCDTCIEIPQEGTKHSLNVSVAGGIAMWHFFCHLNPAL